MAATNQYRARCWPFDGKRAMKPYSIVLGRNWKTGGAVTLPLSQLTHGHLMGMTGYGKSSLMKSIVVQHISQGGCVSILDPAGDISYDVMRRLVATGFYEKHPDAFERFVYLDIQRADNEQRYLPFNILSSDYGPYTAANLVLEAFKRVWVALQDGTSTNIELLVKMASFVASYHNLPLIPYLQHILARPAFRQQILSLTDDAYIREGFADLGIITKDGKIADIVQTTMKRGYLLAFAPVVRYALAQRENILNFGDLLRANRSVALNLHIADPDSKRLIGCLFTVQVEEVAKAWDSRNKRDTPYILMIDEMQNFVAQSGQALDGMFAEARRAGVFVFVAHQYWEQIPPDLRAALSQCGILGTFQVGHEDAMINTGHLKFPIYDRWTKPTPFDPSSPLGREQYYNEDEQRKNYTRIIENLPEREAFIRLPHGGFYRMETLEVPKHADEERVREVEDEYLRLYFRSKAEVENEQERYIAELEARFNAAARGSATPPSNSLRQAERHTPPPQQPEQRDTKDASSKAPPIPALKNQKTQVPPKPVEQATVGLPFVKPIVWDDELSFDVTDIIIPGDDDE